MGSGTPIGALLLSTTIPRDLLAAAGRRLFFFSFFFFFFFFCIFFFFFFFLCAPRVERRLSAPLNPSLIGGADLFQPSRRAGMVDGGVWRRFDDRDWGPVGFSQGVLQPAAAVDRRPLATEPQPLGQIHARGTGTTSRAAWASALRW